MELQLAAHQKDPRFSLVVKALNDVSELQGELQKGATELERVKGLRAVHARFKAGEVDELLSAEMLERSRATVVKAGVLMKTSKMGKLVRRYFVFSDGAVLTAEQGKSGGITASLGSSLRLKAKAPTVRQ